MSKATQKVFEQIKEPEKIGAIEAVKEGVQAVAPGLTLGKIWADIKQEAVEQTKHGAHEVSAALFTGSAFVMYQHDGKDEPGRQMENER